MARLEDEKALSNGSIMQAYKEGSASLRLLEILWVYHSVPKTLLRLSLGEFSDSQAYKSLTELKKLGFIEETPKRGRNPIEYVLTDEGERYLVTNYYYYAQNRYNRPSQKAQDMTTLLRKKEAELLCRSIGVKVLPSEKPTIATMASVFTDYEWVEGETKRYAKLYASMDEKEMRDGLKAGVFYTSKECRALLRKDSGAEVTNHSRFVGILFFSDHFYIVFNSRRRLLKWNADCELATMGALTEITRTWNGYEKYTFKGEPVPAIVFGSSSKMLTALIMGYPHGHIKKLIGERNASNLVKYPYMSGRSEPYKHMYYASINNAGRETLKKLREYSSESDFKKESVDYFEVRSQFVPVSFSDMRRAILYDDNGNFRECIYCNVPDLRELHKERMRFQGETHKTILYANPAYAEAVSRALGEQIDEVRNFDGKIIGTGQYGNNGYVRGYTPPTRPRKSSIRKEQLSTSVDKDVAKTIKKLADENGVSISAMLGKMATDYVKPNNASDNSTE